MIRNILFTATIFISFGAFHSAHAQRTKHVKAAAAKSDVKFLEDIIINVPQVTVSASDPKAVFSDTKFTEKKQEDLLLSSNAIENAGKLQLKYAQLLDLEVEMVQNLNVFKVIDQWFGTKYRLGGSSKDGIDCSALMQIFFASLYGVTIPRTAKEQYHFSRRVSRTEIKEGDLVFFNTIGGVSHVGMYLQNNKFVHASKNGVTISDLYEDYWLKHFIGAGRINNAQTSTALTLKP